MFILKRIFKNLFKKKDIDIDNKNIPVHISIIMDGNGRWARKRGLPRNFGHKEGSNILKKIAEYCDDLGIKYLTVYAFSTENWKRPKSEVATLMALLLDYLKNAEHHLGTKSIKINVIGNTSELSEEIKNEIIRVKEVTKNNTGLILNIALNYGGRNEIIEAVKNIAFDIKNNKISISDITEEQITKRIYTNNIPDPDLSIRTGGEKRLSNFLLWQSAYTELYYSDVLWPDFKKEHLFEAIKEYQKRNRRFGGI